MKKTKNQQHNIILYALIAISIILSIVSITGILNQETETEKEWVCFYEECTEYVELTGEEWARESCEITAQGTVCTTVDEQGMPMQFYLEELLETTSLSEITATRCVKSVCFAEIQVREANYEITLEDLR